MRRRRYALALAALVAGVTGAQASAAADDAQGYKSPGQLVFQTALDKSGNTLTLGGNINLEERGSFLRMDVLSLGIPGTDPALSALAATQLFPPGGFTVVYDRAASTYTVWSTTKQTYFTSASNAAPPTQPAVAAAAAAGSTQDLFGAFGAAKTLKDLKAFSASLNMTGHATVNGHPTTGITYQIARTDRDGNPSEIHGSLALADDLDEVPVQITGSVKTKSVPQSSFRMDLTSLAKSPIPAGDFQVPAGYSKSADIGGVIGKTLPQ
jgi:hypothetical protein